MKITRLYYIILLPMVFFTSSSISPVFSDVSVFKSEQCNFVCTETLIRYFLGDAMIFIAYPVTVFLVCSYIMMQSPFSVKMEEYKRRELFKIE
jgi:hypothetical protein